MDPHHSRPDRGSVPLFDHRRPDDALHLASDRSGLRGAHGAGRCRAGDRSQCRRQSTREGRGSVVPHRPAILHHRPSGGGRQIGRCRPDHRREHRRGQLRAGTVGDGAGEARQHARASKSRPTTGRKGRLRQSQAGSWPTRKSRSPKPACARPRPSSSGRDRSSGLKEATTRNFAKRSAAVEKAKLDLLHTTVSAPSDGVITNLQLTEGEFVAVGQAALTFIDTSDAWINANFRENSLENIKAGDPVELVLDTLPGRVFDAKVQSVGWGVSQGSIDPETGLPKINEPMGLVRNPQRFAVKIEPNRAGLCPGQRPLWLAGQRHRLCDRQCRRERHRRLVDQARRDSDLCQLAQPLSRQRLRVPARPMRSPLGSPSPPLLALRSARCLAGTFPSCPPCLPFNSCPAASSLSVKKGVAVIAVMAAACAFAVLVSQIFVDSPLVLLLAVSLVTFLAFLLLARGQAAGVAAMFLITTAVVPLLAIESVSVAQGFIYSVLAGSALAVLLTFAAQPFSPCGCQRSPFRPRRSKNEPSSPSRSPMRPC